MARAFAEGDPDPAATALLVREQMRARAERRRRIANSIGVPLCSLVALLAVVAWLDAQELVAIPWMAVGWALMAAAVVAILPAVIGASSAAERLPTLAGWRRHTRLADAWSAAALVVTWGLPESEASSRFGPHASRLAASSGGGQAGQRHCRLMADHHRCSADRHGRMAAWCTVVVLQCCAGAIALVTAAACWEAIYSPFTP